MSNDRYNISLHSLLRPEPEIFKYYFYKKIVLKNILINLIRYKFSWLFL